LVDDAADLTGENVHDEPVLLDAAEAGECGRDHRRAKVVAAAGPVLHLGGGVRDRGLDTLLDLLGRRHVHHRVDAPSGPLHFVKR
jgi:hypothetical protein